MKKSLLLSVFSLALLTGCGQDVDNIKKDFMTYYNLGTKSVDFKGYYVVIDKDAQKKLAELEKESDLEKRIYPRDLGYKETLPPLPEGLIKNAELESLTNARKSIESRISALSDTADQEVQKYKDGVSQEISQVRGKIAEIDSQLAPFNALISNEQIAYDGAHKAVADAKDKLKVLNEQFLVKFKEVVVAQKLPIDVESDIDTWRYWSQLNPSNCARTDKNRVKMLPGQEGCIFSEFEGEQAVLEPIFRDLGYDTFFIRKEIFDAEKRAGMTERELSNAKIVAKNQTNINEYDLKRTIKSYESEISTLTHRLENPIDVRRIFKDLRNSDLELAEALNKYPDVVYGYNMSLRAENMKKIGLKFEEFTDENDEPSADEEDFVAVLFVFNDENKKQYSLLSKGKARKLKTFYNAFKSSSASKELSFQINNEVDAMLGAAWLL